MARVLVIDDDAFIRASLARLFEDMGHESLLAGNLQEGAALADTGVDVIYLDLDLPDGDGQKAIDALSDTRGRPEIIVITGMGDNYGAQETLASGAWDYIPKPASPQTVRASLKSALAYRQEAAAGAQSAPETEARTFDACGILGDAPPMRRAMEQIAKAAESEASVLILGETGVGKELVAKAIHANSRRRDKPFVVVDCSNLTETLVESVLYGHRKGAFTGAHADSKGLVAAAHGGTLFLDEVGELPMSLQKSFLRVLQEQRFRPLGAPGEQTSDFRLVAATNRNLETMTRNDMFRSDLLFRLRTVSVTLPPLRERGKDVRGLAEHFTRVSCERYALPHKQLSRQFVKVLKEYPWPGNVRELSNVMEATVIEAGPSPILHPKHLPGHVRVAFLDKPRRKRAQAQAQAAPAVPPLPSGPGGMRSYGEYKAMRDKAYFEQLMEVCEHDVNQASQVSGLSVPSIYRHLGLAGIPTRRSRSR